MFTWIQRYFQKHFGIIIILILLAMAVPLVVVFTPSSGIGQGDRRITSREVFGYNLASPEDQARLFSDANLSATLELGYAGINSDQLQQYALQRAAALHLADQLRIPASTKAEVTAHIQALQAFATPEGNFDAQRYETFRTSLKAGGRITESDVSRVLAADIRADKVRAILAGPGYVLDADVISQLQRTQTQWTLGQATISYESFKPAISASNDQLAKFFGENTFRYEIPPRVSAAYVSYPLEAYLPQVSATAAEQRSLFDAAPARFQKPATAGQAAAPAGPADFELVRAQVESTIRLAKARQLATKAASDLTLALYDGKISNDPAVLESFLSAHHVKLLPLQPFTEETGPAELGHSAEVAQAAFKLNAERFYSDAEPVANGAVVLFWRELLPSRTPLLNEVQAQVQADFIDGEKRKQFVELGRKAKTQLAAQLQTGTEFATAAKTVADSLGVTIEAQKLPPFSMANPPKDSSFTAFNVLETLSQGQVSDMVITRDQGVLVYAIERKLPDMDPSHPPFITTRQQIATITSRMGASRILSEMVEVELRRSEPKP